MLIILSVNLLFNALAQTSRDLTATKKLYDQEIRLRQFCNSHLIVPCEGYNIDKWDREHPDQQFDAYR